MFKESVRGIELQPIMRFVIVGLSDKLCVLEHSAKTRTEHLKVTNQQSEFILPKVMKVLEQKSAEATTTDNQQSKLKFTTGADGSTNNLNWKLDICDGYSISLILGLSAQEYIFPRYCGFDARRFFLLEYQHAHFIYQSNSREESIALVKTIMDIPRKNNTQLIINLLGCDKRGIY